MRREVSPKKRSEIITLVKEGYSVRKISDKVHVPKSTVSDIKRRWNDNPSGCGSPIKKRTGRPRKTNARLDRNIVRLCEANRFSSARTIRFSLGDLGSNISDRTVSRRLRSAGFYARRPARKPFVNAFQRRRRVMFAQKYSQKPMEFWKRTIFSDESSFYLYGNRGVTTLRRRVGERFNPKCTMATMKHPTSVMVWGCFSYKGVGRLRIIENKEKINQNVYLDILNHEMTTTKNEHFPDGDAVFQDDNAPCHRARKVKDWLSRSDIDHIHDWPGQSPDINPIENLWTEIGRVISQRSPTSRNEIISAIIHAWFHVITPEKCQKLVESIPRRLSCVIRAKGFPTKY